MYHHSSSLALAAELYFDLVFKNEDKMPGWLMSALKTATNPAVIKDVIITSNFTDVFGEKEYMEAPSFVRSDYNHVLKKDTKTRCITSSDELMLCFIDVYRQFRVDFSAHIVLFSEGDNVKAIDVLDVNVYSSNLNPETDEHMVQWFLERRNEAESYINRFREFSPNLKVIVDNSN